MYKIVFIAYLLFSMLTSTAQKAYTIKFMNFTAQQQDVRMAYVFEKAMKPNGNTVLLLHGKNFSGSYWAGVMNMLLDNGYDVVAPDQIGFGESSRPEKFQYSFQQLALNTKLLMDTLGIKNPILLGHSMGGMLAVRYALMYPGNCKQLILEDPLGLEDWKLSVPYSSIDMEYKKELTKSKEDLKKYMLVNYFHNNWKAGYDLLLDESSKYLGDKNAAWSMALTSDMIYSQPVCYEFDQLKVPVVLIIGDLDRTAPGKEKADPKAAAMLGNYPELGKEVALKIPDCKLFILKETGHIPHIENFSLFMSTLNKEIIKQ